MDCENCRHLTVVGLHDTGPWSSLCLFVFVCPDFAGKESSCFCPHCACKQPLLLLLLMIWETDVNVYYGCFPVHDFCVFVCVFFCCFVFGVFCFVFGVFFFGGWGVGGWVFVSLYPLSSVRCRRGCIACSVFSSFGSRWHCSAPRCFRGRVIPVT